MPTAAGESLNFMEVKYNQTNEVREIGLESGSTPPASVVVLHNLSQESIKVEVTNCNGKHPPAVLREVADTLAPLYADETQSTDSALVDPPPQSPNTSDTGRPDLSTPESSRNSPSEEPHSPDEHRDTESKDTRDCSSPEEEPASSEPTSTTPKKASNKRSAKSKQPEEASAEPSQTPDPNDPAVPSLKLTSSKGSVAPSPSKDSPTKSAEPAPTPATQPEEAGSNQADKTRASKKTSDPEPESAPQTTNVPTPPTGLNAAQLKQWLEQSLLGDPAPSPTGPLRHIEVISWMQVPQILKELESSSSQIRLTFPETTPADAELTTEQEQVRNFLANHAGSALKDISSELTEKIATCVLFRRESPAFSAKQYVGQFDLDMKNTEKLRVCDVVRVTEDFKPTKAGAANMQQYRVKGRDVILSTIEEGLKKTNDYRSFAIEVTTQNKEIFRQELSRRYYNLPEPKPDTTKTKIWVAEDFTVGASPFKEYDFLAFIGEEIPSPAPVPRKEEERPGDGSVGAKEVAHKPIEGSEDTPVPPSRTKRAGSKVAPLNLGLA